MTARVASSAIVLTQEQRIAGFVYGGMALLAAIDTALTNGLQLPVLGCLVLALSPWLAVVLRRELPQPLFAALGIIPVAAVVLLEGLGIVIFMATTVASRVASVSDRVGLVTGVALAAVGLPFLPPVSGHEPDVGSIYFAFGNVFAVLVGVLVRRISRLSIQLREAADKLADAAAVSERERIARDVHDLVAHSLTVAVLNIGGARRIIRTDPDAAERALLHAERVCRDSLDGIRKVVGLLREQDGRAVTLDIRSLVDTYEGAGKAVVLHVDGDLHAAPPLARGTLERVVQEALANAARYGAPGAPIEVDVSVSPDQLRAEVRNAYIRDAKGTDTAGGFGLVGLREQVRAVGGELSSGPRGSSWLVACRIPIPSVPARRRLKKQHAAETSA